MIGFYWSSLTGKCQLPLPHGVLIDCESHLNSAVWLSVAAQPVSMLVVLLHAHHLLLCLTSKYSSCCD